MFSAEKHIQEIHELDHGRTRLNAINAAITEADNDNAHEWRIYFRYEYVEESIFYDDGYKAIIRFPEMLGIFDEHPELEEDYYNDVLQAYKWIVENVSDYYQISRDQVEQYFADYEKRCKKYGYSLRASHLKKSTFYKHIDKKLAHAEFNLYRETPRDQTSDCKACEASQEMKFQLYLGNEREALAIAQPLFDGKLRCGEVPHVTYGGLTAYYLYKGDLDEAAYHGARCERLIGNEQVFLNYTGILLELFSATHPAHGWKVLKQSTENYLASHNPLCRLYYATGAYRLLNVVVELTEKPEDRFTNSAILKLLPVPCGEEGISLEALRDYYYETAKDLAARFDSRNGTTYYTDRLNTKLKKAENGGKEDRPAVLHGLIQRQPSMLAVSLPEDACPTTEELAQRIRDGFPEDLELISAEGNEDVRITFRKEGKLYDISIFLAEVREPILARPVAGLTKEAFQNLDKNPRKYLFTTELGDDAVSDYALMMRMIAVLFPELVCFADLRTQHAYPASWVRYAAKYPDAVTPSDLFGLYLSGSESSDEVWITTLGMSTLGMRDLEMIGADHKNYDKLADLLDGIAQQCVERGMLPDAGTQFALVSAGEQRYKLTWGAADQYCTEGSIAQEMEREVMTGAVLVKDGKRLTLPSEFEPFAGDFQLQSTNTGFYRRLRLAKAAFPEFRKALEKPFEWAAARVEFELDEDTADEFGYGIELLWAEVSRVENGHIYAEMAEISEALPDLKKGDEIELTADDVVAWNVVPQGWEDTVSETTANRLEALFE